MAAGHAVAIGYGMRPETPADIRAAVGPDPDLIPLWRDRSLQSQIRAVRTIPKLAYEWAPDIIHLHSSFAIVAGALSVPRHLPIVCSPHAYSFTMAEPGGLKWKLFRQIETLAARRVDVIGAVSQSEAQTAKEALNAPNVVVVANGIPELDTVPSHSRSSLPSRVVGMGRAVKQRQPESCARILAAVRDLAPVEWIGGGSDSEAGAAALEQHEIPMSGWLERDEAIDRLGSAGIYLHYTAWDGQPLSILEAMARDVAVVASDIPANRELLGSDLVCSSEAAAIETIRGLLTDSERAARHLETQRARRGHYSTARMTEQWLDVYRMTLAARRSH